MLRITPLNAGLLFIIAMTGILWWADRTVLAKTLEHSRIAFEQSERYSENWKEQATTATRSLRDAGLTVP